MKPALRWLDDVAEHDYAAAERYLSLLLDEQLASYAAMKLRQAELTSRRANDILRAAGRPALPLDDPGVHRDLLKVLAGERLSPVLTVSFAGQAGGDIADGYHRVSLAYAIDPAMEIPLRIATVRLLRAKDK